MLLRLRNAPSMVLVMAPECCFSTPRIIMQKCRASQITPTPHGIDGLLNASRDLLGQALLNLQTPRENVHDAGNFAQADDPFLGQIGHVDFPKKGSRWCSHMLKNSMSLTITISSYFT